MKIKFILTLSLLFCGLGYSDDIYQGSNTIGSDRVNGVDYPRNKIVFGPNDSVSDVAPTNPLPSADTIWMAYTGQYPGAITVQKFGGNDNIDTTEEVIWTEGGTYGGFLTTASAVRVRAGGNVNDTSTGSGARTITVDGLDENYELASETITLAGASASTATTTTFIRVFRATVLTVGTYAGNNDGLILVETTGGTALVSIDPSRGQSELAVYSIPAGYTAYIISVFLNVDSNKSASVYLYRNDNIDDTTIPYSPKRIVVEYDFFKGSFTDDSIRFKSIPERTDIYFTAIGPSGGASVEARINLVLLPNP